MVFGQRTLRENVSILNPNVRTRDERYTETESIGKENHKEKIKRGYKLQYTPSDQLKLTHVTHIHVSSALATFPLGMGFGLGLR